MKSLTQFITEDTLSKEVIHKDYDRVEYCDTKKEKQELASKYGIESIKKDDIKHAILLKLRDLRKSASLFDEEDYRDFYRLLPDSLAKLPEYLAKENPKFVLFVKDYFLEHRMKGKLKNWIGINPGRDANYSLSYADIHTVKFYNKILEFIANNTPKTRTVKDEIFDSLVNKFTDLLSDYKKEYLKRVKDFAKKKYSETLPKDLEELKKKRDDSRKRLDSLDWRKDRVEYNREYEIHRKLSAKIERIVKFFEKYTEKEYIDECVKNATEEFENNIKILSDRIVKDELDIDKLEVKSVHDDPKVFNMKITDGTKNLFCRSILAAEYSSYMIPHFRFIITNRSKDDSHYND